MPTIFVRVKNAFINLHLCGAHQAAEECHLSYHLESRHNFRVECPYKRFQWQSHDIFR